jgi:hypothetical protein
MRSRLLAVAVCLIALVCMLATTGCASHSPEQSRARALTRDTDRREMWRDIDWMLGLNRPSTLTKPTVTPYW